MKLKRLVAGVLSAAMMLSIGSTLAFAADSDYVNNTISFNTTLNLSTDALNVPAVTYTYTLTPNTSVTTVELDDGTEVNVTKGTSDDTETLSFTSVDELKTVTTTDNVTFKAVTKEVTWSVSPDDLGITESGFYVYELTQAIEADIANSSLYTTNTTTHYVYLQVSYTDEENETLAITDVLIYEDDTVSEDGKFAGFVNYYGVDKDGNATTLTFQVEAYKFGSLANANKEFQYTVKVTDSAKAMATGDSFNVVDNGTDVVLYVNSDGYLAKSADTTDAYVFVLSAGESLSVKAVTDTMTFEVNVTDEDNDSYTAASRTYSTEEEGEAWADVKDGDDVVIIDSETGATVTYTMQTVNEDDTTYTNDMTQGLDFAGVRGTVDDENITDNEINLPETGVILEFAPFALMVLAAGAFISLRFVRATRKNEE